MTAAAGSPGAGKTEVTKELAWLAGRMCVVFNCVQSINVLLLSKLLLGTVQVSTLTAIPVVRVSVKITVRVGVCERLQRQHTAILLQRQHTAILPVILTLTRSSVELL